MRIREVQKIVEITSRAALRQMQPAERKKIYEELREQILVMQISKSCVSGNLAYTDDKGKRYTTRTGRLFASKLKLTNYAAESKVQHLAETANNHIFNSLTVEIHTGAQIMKNYKNNVGTSSCMSDNNSDCTALYADNPDVYSQIVMLENNNTARAMLIKLDNGMFLMDRVYTDSSYLFEQMRAYARRNGYFYNKEGYIYYNGDEIPTQYRKHMFVTGLNWEEGGVPYQDTLRRGKIDSDGLLELSSCYANRDYDYDMTRTDGRIDHHENTCCNCGEHIRSNDMYSNDNGDIYCNQCYCELFYNCSHCGRECRTSDQNEVVNQYGDSVNVCDRCFERYYRECHHCGTNYRIDDMKKSSELSVFVCEECENDFYTHCDTCGDVIDKDEEKCTICQEKYNDKVQRMRDALKQINQQIETIKFIDTTYSIERSK